MEEKSSGRQKKVEGSCGAAKGSQEGPKAARSSQELQIAFLEER